MISDRRGQLIVSDGEIAPKGKPLISRKSLLQVVMVDHERRMPVQIQIQIQKLSKFTSHNKTPQTGTYRIISRCTSNGRSRCQQQYGSTKLQAPKCFHVNFINACNVTRADFFAEQFSTKLRIIFSVKFAQYRTGQRFVK